MRSDFPTGRPQSAYANHADSLWIANDLGHLGALVNAANERHHGYLAEAAQARRLTEAGLPSPRRSLAPLLAALADRLRVRALARVRRPAVPAERPIPAPFH